jgi:hypothetical protein
MLSRFATLGGGITDPYWSSVSFLLVGNGGNGTNTNIKDSSSNNLTITNTGSTVISTAINPPTVTNAGSGTVRFNGTTNYLTVPSPILDLGASSFTIELWWNSTLKVDYQSILIGTSNLGAWLHATSSGSLLYGINNSTYTTSGDVCNGVWHHIAFVRNGGSACKLYVDGASAGTATDGTNITGTSTATIGTYQGGRLCNAYIYDLRITKGVARYTANYTPPPFPPTAAFPIG